MPRNSKSILSTSAAIIISATLYMLILTIGVTAPNTASASQFHFVVDTSVPSLFSANTIRITGQPSSGSAVLSCGFAGSGTFPIQNAVVIRPPNGALVIEIVPLVEEPLPPGTAITHLDLITSCGDFNLYEGSIQQ